MQPAYDYGTLVKRDSKGGLENSPESNLAISSRAKSERCGHSILAILYADGRAGKSRVGQSGFERVT